MAGSLTCVGLGMLLGGHITPISRSYIENADVVFTLVSNGVVELWVEEMNPNVVSLQKYYQEGVSRNKTYEQMVQAIVREVQNGKNVVGAFYGHPGVFAKVPHDAIKQVREIGANAHMEPGISAEDCLFADLGIDPGQLGCQQYEASQFMFYKRHIDPTAYLILWQVGIAGDKSLAKFSTGEEHRRLLTELLQEVYPAAHKVLIYEAKVLPIDKTRIEEVELGRLPLQNLNQHTTLVIPPSKKLMKNKKLLDKLAALEQ